jgi:uncharacterized protein (DUF849 family)
MLHLHIRDAQGHHSLDVQGYRDALPRCAPQWASTWCCRSPARPRASTTRRRRSRWCARCGPRRCRWSLREVDQPEIGEQGLADFFGWLARERVTQVILYDVADLQRWQSLRARGVLPEAPWFLLRAGPLHRGPDLQPARPGAFCARPHRPRPWAVCAFGATEHACVTAAAALGGHVRVGFENNLQLKDGSRAPHNAALVAQAAEAAACLGRPLATARHIRERFGG